MTDGSRAPEGTAPEGEEHANDPAHQYAGKDIPRTAIESRNAQIEDLLTQVNNRQRELAEARAAIREAAQMLAQGDGPLHSQHPWLSSAAVKSAMST